MAGLVDRIYMWMLQAAWGTLKQFNFIFLVFVRKVLFLYNFFLSICRYLLACKNVIYDMVWQIGVAEKAGINVPRICHLGRHDKMAKR